MTALYESQNERDCDDVKAKLVAHFESRPAFENEKASGGRPSDAEWQYVFLALQTPPVYYWDDVQDDLPSCMKYVKKYADKAHVKKFYIGIASGEEYVSAMKRRYDDFKDDEGLNEIITIYETTEQQECRDMERALIKEFFTHEKNINDNEGGAGRNSKGPNYYVYLALRITSQ